jgi:methylated-DNA-protein-cysteine methyltransferase-like protein
MESAASDLERFAPRIYEVVGLVPYGHVTTYGDIATVVGDGCDARLVGAAMSQVRNNEVPWQRVVNAKGTISARSEREMSAQRTRLEAEGVSFDTEGRIDLTRYRWSGPQVEWAAQHHFHILGASPEEPAQPRLF